MHTASPWNDRVSKDAISPGNDNCVALFLLLSLSLTALVVSLSIHLSPLSSPTARNPFTFEGQRSSAIYTRVLRGMYKRRHIFERSKTITLLESLDPWILYSHVRDTSLLFRTDTCIRVPREDNVGTCWSHFYLLQIDFATSVFQGFSRV